MKEQLANMTIIELVRTGHSYAASIQTIETYSAIVTEMGSRLEALNLAHIAAMNNLRSSTSTNDSLAAENVALQSERDQLAAQLADVVAENATLKAGVTYFAYSPEYGFDYFKDRQSAIDTAQDEIDAYREDAEDGWSEDVQRVSWGVVLQQAQGFDAQGLHTSDSQHTYQTCNYRLVDALQIPATDRFLAEQRAQGIEQWIASRNGAWNGTTKEAEKFAAQLRNEVKG